MSHEEDEKLYGQVKGPYTQKSVKKRIEALFLDNIGKVLSREQIQEAAKDPGTGLEPENWHQRLSELRTDDGYTILSWRNRGDLKVQEYLLPSPERRAKAGKRIRPNDETWVAILERASYCCEWDEGGERCGLHEGDIDPVGGGRVKLTPDHKSPHSLDPNSDPRDSNQWRALCGRHQVIKKNYWDNSSGKLNVYAIVQSATNDNEEMSKVIKDTLKPGFLEDYQAIYASLEACGIAILPPMDACQSMTFLAQLGIRPTATMLDPWYNKGFGGQRTDYNDFIISLLSKAAALSQHVFLWGFPEIVSFFVDKLPKTHKLVAWLTWYYKNNPSVIRGWRSSQNACLHLSVESAKLYPQHFLNEAQKELLARKKLRYMPGPTSVIEAPLNIGFVGKKEQTGHPAQKPLSVFETLYLMSTQEGDLIFDPLSGSGTTGNAAKHLRRMAILCDESEEYTQIAEKRLGIARIHLEYLSAKRNGIFNCENTQQDLAPIVV